MTISIKDLGLDRLSVDERLALIDALWESIAMELGSRTLTPAQREELKRRLDAYCGDPKIGSPWEEVRERLLAGLPRLGAILDAARARIAEGRGISHEEFWQSVGCFENDPRFLARVEAARESLREGRGERIEDVE